MTGPTLRILSLGAGVQSTAVAILAARGDLPRLDAAIFADTGWEPKAVYEHLGRLDREVLQPAGIPLHRVSVGNIRADALDPSHRFASMPMYVTNPDGSQGMGRRQCTSEYKLKPILREVRRLLGAPPREDGVPGRVPKGRWAEQWIGISTDEADRALTSKTGVAYARPRYPLLEPSIREGLSRADCQRINAAAGFADTPKSACIGCPFHGNHQWRALRDRSPAEWADAVAFDHAIRNGSARANAMGKPLRGQMYLHRSRLPLDVAPIDHVTYPEWAARQGNLLDEIEELEPRACSPFGCRVEESREEINA